MTMIYATGHLSGAHMNPAVTIGLATAGPHPWRDVLPYAVAQVAGGLMGAFALYLMACGKGGFYPSDGFAANGYGDHSPGGYEVCSSFITEAVMTFFFLAVILGSTAKRAAQGFAPLAIGLALTVVHLVSIPVTNTSVNPARSIAVAPFAGDWAVDQLWLFIAAPIFGAVLAGLLSRWLNDERNS